MTGSDDVVITRFLPVPREQVFDAWLDPTMLARFMRPGDMAESSVEVDPRVGGMFKVVMNHGKPDGEHWGRYLVIDRPRRISFTWISANTDRQETVVTVELREKDRGTELVLTHTGLPKARRDAHRKGWGAIVERLAARD